jgi:hypothetical protein
MDDAVRNHAVSSENRDQLLTSDLAQQFFAEVNKHAKRFMSDEHFTVDGALIQAGLAFPRLHFAGVISGVFRFCRSLISAFR